MSTKVIGEVQHRGAISHPGAAGSSPPAPYAWWQSSATRRQNKTWVFSWNAAEIPQWQPSGSELEAPVLATSWSRAPQELRKGCWHLASHHRGQQQPCAAQPRDAPSQIHRKYDFPTETGSPLWMCKVDPRACCKLRGTDQVQSNSWIYTVVTDV